MARMKIFYALSFLSLMLIQPIICVEVGIDDNNDLEVFSVHSLIQTIAIPETLDLGSALNMVSSPWAIPDNTNELFDATIPSKHGNVPLLHHLFSLYQRFENQPKGRDAITSLFVRLLFLGANPNSIHPMSREPSLLFKTIFLREIVLADALLEAGAVQQARDPQPVLNLMMNIPCDLVPMTKLLLHADEMLKVPKFNDSFAGVQGRREFVASASRQPGSKPIPRSNDLFEISKSYATLVPKLGFIDSMRGLDMSAVVSSLGDSGDTLLKKYLNGHNRHRKDPSDSDHSSLLSQLVAAVNFEGIRGRNTLHTAAAAGHAPIFSALGTFLDKLIKQIPSTDVDVSAKVFASGLLKALLKQDGRGQTPLDIALIRWDYRSRLDLTSKAQDNRKNKKSSEVVEVLQELISQVQKVTKDSESDRALVFSTTTSSLKKKPEASLYGQIDPLRKVKNDEKFQHGGWDSSIWSPSSSTLSSTEKKEMAERCDILEIDASELLNPEFSEWFFRNHLSLGTPLVIRQGVPHLGRHNLAKENFVKRYGHHQVAVGTIPYGHSFGVSSQVTTLKDIANENTTTGDNSVSYAFTTPEDGANGWAAKLASDIPMPDWLSQIMHQFPESGVETQFYLGPKGSGAPVHFHGHAINLLTHGMKEWVVSPPISATYSKAKATERYSSEHNVLNQEQSEYSDDDEHTFRCTQHAGDIFYVPTLWGHGTFNHAQSIGVAFEISLESFCME